MLSANKELDPMKEVRSILWTLLIAATVASVAANIAHALVTHGLTLAAVGPVLFAMLAPVALLGLFHLMAAWTRAAADRSAVFWFFLGAIVLLAGAAFRLSFAAIRDLAIGYGYGWADAALFPLILDGLIAVCTVGLVAATRPRRKAKRTRPSLPQRVRDWWRDTPAVATHTAAEHHVDAPVLRDEAPVTHPVEAPAMRDAAPVQAATQTATVRDAEPEQSATQQATTHDVLRDADTEEIPVTSDDSRDAAAKQGNDVPLTRRLTAVPTPRPAATHTPASPATQTGTDRDAEADDEFLLRAKQLVEAGRTKAPVDVVVRVLRGKANGASNRDVADATGLTESKVQRIVKAARELQAAEEPEPAFA